MTRRGRLEYAPPTAHTWTVIAHAHVVSILPASASPELVARLWSAATTASVSLESYVAAFPLFGPDAVEDFAVALIEDVRQGAERPEARIEIVLRGNGVVRLETPAGTRTIDARSSQPWYLAEFDDVTSFVLAGAPLEDVDLDADAGRDTTMPLLSGVVPAGWTRWTPNPPVSTETGELDDTVLGLGTGRREAPVARPVEVERPAVAAAAGTARPEDKHEDEDEHEHEHQDDADPLTGDTVLGTGAGTRAQADATDAVEGETILSSRRHRGPQPAAAEAASSAAELDDTILTAGRRPAAPSPGGAAAIPDEGERPVLLPVYSFRVGAEAYGLERPAYLGRRPSAPRIATGSSPRLVSVGSPRQEVSSTHLEIRQEGTTVVVTDLRSTNGTIVSAPGADRLTLRQGQSVVVAPGTRIDIGDGNVVEILPAR
jgi:hypothetical protein